MIRLLHTADTHLGVENYGRVDAATGLSSRLGDFLACLDEAVDHAISQKLDLLVFAGDAYKTRDPSPTHQREFARRIHRLCQAGIPCFLLVGNHDLPNAASRAHTTEIFDTLAVPGVTVARSLATHRLQTPAGPIQIVALPWVTRAGLLTRDETRGRSLEQLNALLLEKVARELETQLSGLDPSVPAILAGHCTVEGATYGSERSVTLGQDLLLPRSLLADARLDYLALGHLHRHQVLCDRPPMVYSGSLERLDFGEEREEKGFVEVTLPDHMPHGFAAPVQVRFVPVNARRFLTIELTVEDGRDPTSAALEAIATQPVAGSVVRVLVHTESGADLRQSNIRLALREAQFVASVSQDSPQSTRHRRFTSGAAGLTPLQALAAYLEAKGTPPDRQKQLLECARRLIQPAECFPAA